MYIKGILCLYGTCLEDIIIWIYSRAINSILAFNFQGRPHYFYNTVLMFGLSTGPFCFTKVLRPLVKHWREQGINTANYLDDMAEVCDTYEKCANQAEQVKSDLQADGFIINDEKSVWVPCQGLGWLGLFWNLIKGVLEIPEDRLLKVDYAISDILNRLYGVSARKIAHLAGLLISLAPSLGHITQLMTRNMYFLINARVNWDAPLNISRRVDILKELIYWQNNLRRLYSKTSFDNECRIYPIKVIQIAAAMQVQLLLRIRTKQLAIECFLKPKKRSLLQQES